VLSLLLMLMYHLYICRALRGPNPRTTNRTPDMTSLRHPDPKQQFSEGGEQSDKDQNEWQNRRYEEKRRQKVEKIFEKMLARRRRKDVTIKVPTKKEVQRSSGDVVQVEDLPLTKEVEDIVVPQKDEGVREAWEADQPTSKIADSPTPTVADLTNSKETEDTLEAEQKKEVKDCEVVKEETIKGKQSDSVEEKEVFVEIVPAKIRTIFHNTVADCQPINLEPFILCLLQRTNRRRSENRARKNKLNNLLYCYRKH
jgi:hypothetical protein